MEPRILHRPFLMLYPKCRHLPFLLQRQHFPQSAYQHLREFLLLRFAFGPSSHTTAKAFLPCMAFHVESATTATPSLISTTCFTPGTVFAFDASKLFTFPPNTGTGPQLHTTFQVPHVHSKQSTAVNFFGSIEAVNFFPDDVKIFLAFERGLSGTFSFAAASQVRRTSAFVPRLHEQLHQLQHCTIPCRHSIAQKPQ